MSALNFSAPWSRSLKRSTIAASIVLVTVDAGLLLYGQSNPIWLLVVALPPIVLLVSFACGIRGYGLTENEIQIYRWGWVTRFPLAELQTVEGKAEALQNAVFFAANFGVFSYTGIYWSRELKLFRAFVTDPSRAVVLRFRHKRVVISPHDPQQFIVRTRTLLKTGQFPR
jgi:hypothetical protein